MRRKLRRTAQRLGLDIRRYGPQSSPVARRASVMAGHGVDVVLDVGANRGQYAGELRSAGYTERIVSFEPLAEPFEALSREAKQDPRWRCLKLGLGASPSRSTMHVAGNQAASSSLLRMEGWIADAAPHQAYVGTEMVNVARLDDVAPTLVGARDRMMLKLDVQGYELEVLRGGPSTLRRAEVLEAELSLVALYEDQPLWRETVDYLRQAGLELVCLDPNLHDDDGRLLQMDGIFARSRRLNSRGT